MTRHDGSTERSVLQIYAALSREGYIRTCSYQPLEKTCYRSDILYRRAALLTSESVRTKTVLSPYQNCTQSVPRLYLVHTKTVLNPYQDCTKRVLEREVEEEASN